MNPLLNRPRIHLLVLALPFLILTEPGSCVNSRLSILNARIPDLSPEFARHLVQDRDAEFLAYASHLGYRKLKDARGQVLQPCERASSPAELGAALEFTRPYVERIDRALEEVFDSPEYGAEARIRDQLDEESAFRLREVGRKDCRLRDGVLQPIDSQLHCLEQLHQEFEFLGYQRGVMFVEIAMADVVVRQGKHEKRQQLLESAARRARELNERYMLCQILATLGPWDDREDRSMNDRHLQEAFEIATRCRIPDQAARALSFMSANARSRGQYARALELARRAIEVCHEEGGGGLELRYVFAAMHLFAQLGCWELIDRLAARLDPLARDLNPTERRVHAHFLSSARQLNARSSMRSGRDFERGNEVFRSTCAEGRTTFSPVWYGGALEQWSTALYEAGRLTEALEIVREGLRHCDSLHVGEHAHSLALRRVRILSELGRSPEAFEAMADLEHRFLADPPVPPVAIAYRAVAAKLRLESGDRARASRRIEEALAELSKHARGLDGGPSSELALSMFEDVRTVAHRVLAPDPSSGYRLEMDWRALVADLGRGAAADRDTRAFALGAGLPAFGPHDMHIVFHVEEDAIVRWTGSRKGVRRDRIPIGRDSCSALVRRATQQIQATSPRPSADDAAEVLARMLLPTEVLAPSGTALRRLWISPDGPLTALVFDALPVNAAGDAVAGTLDVAYLHTLERRRSRKETRQPVVVTEPTIPDAIRRRHPSLTSLPAAELETARVTAAWPEALVIRGPAATRDNVLAAWERASRIYVAAHLVQDPEIPLATFIPLAAPAGTPEDQAFLDPSDIRAADLSGCELVVLSACAGGAPYVSSPGVSLGISGAFLDAGAAAVVRTAFPIRDEDARRFASVLLEEWQRRDGATIEALNAARRRLLREAPDGPWLAWSIAVRGLPSPRTSAELAAR